MGPSYLPQNALMEENVKIFELYEYKIIFAYVPLEIIYNANNKCTAQIKRISIRYIRLSLVGFVTKQM